MISLSDKFTYRKLLRYTLPGMLMVIFSSIYGVVDGFFISNFVGSTAFASVNFIIPVVYILGFIGTMFGAGGSALIGKTMGEGNQKKANEIFSMLVYISIILGVFLSIVGIVYIRKIASLLGAEGLFLEDSVIYGRIVLLALPFAILQFEFQSLFSTAEKPKIGMYITIGAGLTNIVLDILFVVVFSWGLEGAAAATALSQVVGGVIPLIYFGQKNTSLLQLTEMNFDLKALIKTCSNGISELVSSLAMSTVGILYNVQLLKYAGENGIAAFGVIMYVSMIFMAIFIGYSMGAAPIISYNYGAKNKKELKSLLKKSFVIIISFSIIMFAGILVFSKPISQLYVGYDDELMAMTQRAFFLYSFAFLFVGISIFGSAFFTALNDGITSAMISFLRTLVFQVGAVIIFPLIWQLDGIWISVVFAEMMSVIIILIFIQRKHKKYQYY